MNRFMTLALSAIASVGLFSFGIHNVGSGGPGRMPDMPKIKTATTSDTAFPAASTNNGNLFSLTTMKGSHGFSYSGDLTDIGPIASAGPIIFDGKGNLSATYNVTDDGTLYQGTFLGTYTVNANGTGTVTLNLAGLGIQSHGSFVIVNNGDETFFTSTDPGQTVTGVTKKMRPNN